MYIKIVTTLDYSIVNTHNHCVKYTSNNYFFSPNTEG